MVIGPIAEKYGIRTLIISSYQAASGGGGHDSTPTRTRPQAAGLLCAI